MHTHTWYGVEHCVALHVHCCLLSCLQARKDLGGISAALGRGTANTALVYHARRLMALHEGDLPYAVRDEALMTLVTCAEMGIHARVQLAAAGVLCDRVHPHQNHTIWPACRHAETYHCL